MANLQPPPTFTLPIVVDEKTKKATFSPIWLKWFLDLANTLNTVGGTTVTGDADSIALPARVFASTRQPPTLFQADSVTMIAQRSFGRAPPAVPDVRPGVAATVTRDAQGYTVGIAVDSDQNILANKIFGD